MGRLGGIKSGDRGTIKWVNEIDNSYISIWGRSEEDWEQKSGEEESRKETFFSPPCLFFPVLIPPSTYVSIFVRKYYSIHTEFACHSASGRLDELRTEVFNRCWRRQVACFCINKVVLVCVAYEVYDGEECRVPK